MVNGKIGDSLGRVYRPDPELHSKISRRFCRITRSATIHPVDDESRVSGQLEIDPPGPSRRLPPAGLAESFQRSCAWNCSSGKQIAQGDAEERPRREGQGIGRYAVGDRIPPAAPRRPRRVQRTDAESSVENPRLTRWALPSRVRPARSIRLTIVMASAGLWTRVAMNTPRALGSQPLVGPDGAGQGNPSGQGVQGQAKRRGTPVQRGPLGRDSPGPRRAPRHPPTPAE